MTDVNKTNSQVDGEQSEVVVIDGVEYTKEELIEMRNGYMRQNDYTKKTQALAEEKKALKSNEANQQVDATLNSQPDANQGNIEMTKMYLDVKMQQLKDIHGESFDEVAVLTKATEMLKKGIAPTDIDFDFIAKGLSNTVNNDAATREAIKKEIMAEMKANGVDTSSVINSGDHAGEVQDGTYGLSPQELNYCAKSGEDPAKYAEWKKRLKR